MSFVIGVVLWGFGVVCGVLLAAALVAWWVLQHADIDLDGPQGPIFRRRPMEDGAAPRGGSAAEWN